jgi:hypothetical protein
VLRKLIIGSAALLLVGCASTTDASIDTGSSELPSTSPVKLDSKDCSVLITTTYDLESAVQSELNGESDPEALQTMNQLVPVFQELQAKYSKTPKSEAEIWLEQMTTDLVSITDEINTNGKLINTELGSQLIANIDRLDEFCPSAE